MSSPAVRLAVIAVILAPLSGLAAVPATAGDDGALARTRILTDAELRRIIAGADLDAIEARRIDRFADRLDLDLDRVRARQGTLPLAAEQALRHAEQDLNRLKARAPHHPEIPLLERDLSRVERRAR